MRRISVSSNRYSSITISYIQIINHETLNIVTRSYLLVKGNSGGPKRERPREAVQIDKHMHKKIQCQQIRTTLIIDERRFFA